MRHSFFVYVFLKNSAEIHLQYIIIKHVLEFIKI